MKPDEYLNGWAKKTGWKAGIVYDCLWRHADRAREAFPSIELMADEWGVDRKTIMKGLQTLIDFNIIKKEAKRSKSGKFLHNTYLLLAKEHWIEPSPSQGHGSTKSFSGTYHVLHKDYKGTHITKPIKNKGNTIGLDNLLAKREARRSKKSPWGSARNNKPTTTKINHTPLDRDQLVQIGVEMRVAYFDVKETYDKVLLSIENGNPYNIVDVKSATKLWVGNALHRGEFRFLAEDYQVDAEVKSYSTEAIEKAEKMQKAMEAKGL